MKVPHVMRSLISAQRPPRPATTMNSPYPASGRSGYPVANAQAGGR